MLKGKEFWVFILVFMFLAANMANTEESFKFIEEDPWSEKDIQNTFPQEIRYTKDGQRLSKAWSGGPQFDSGWIPIATGESKIITHNLGGNTDDYVVDMQYYKSDIGIHHQFYGGADLGTRTKEGTVNNHRWGCFWSNLTSSSIRIARLSEDQYAEKVRIRIWIDPSDIYDSGWVSVTPGFTPKILTHNIGGATDNYIVYMEFRKPTDGVHQIFYGGNDYGTRSHSGTRENERVGVYWHNLTDSSISVTRRSEDTFSLEVRVRIWNMYSATYDSDWQTVLQDMQINYLHNIYGNRDDYIIYLEYKSPAYGVNQCYYGGADFGTLPPDEMGENDRVGGLQWNTSVSHVGIARRDEDIYAPQMRVRIWNCWTPTAPSYDTLWTGINVGSKVFTHNIGGSVDRYLINLQYKDNAESISQRYYGGVDFGSTSFGGARDNDRVGAYWYNLNDSQVTVFRRGEDDFANNTRLRIWYMPKPDYDSGWLALTAGAIATNIIHEVGGNILDYLVDMQYRSGLGINNIMYGGNDIDYSIPTSGGCVCPGGESANLAYGASGFRTWIDRNCSKRYQGCKSLPGRKYGSLPGEYAPIR